MGERIVVTKVVTLPIASMANMVLPHADLTTYSPYSI